MEKRGKKKGTFPSSAQIWGFAAISHLVQAQSSSAKAPKHLHQIWHGTVSFYKIHRVAEGVAGPQRILA